MAFPAILAALGRAAAGGGGAAARGGAAMAESAVAKTGGAQNQLAKAMETTGKKTASFKDQISSVTDTYNRVSAAGYMFKNQVEGAFGAVAGQATMFASALKSMADPLTALTALSNPAAVKQFELAFADAMAVMGRVALPVVEALTRAMRVVGNMYARMEPYLLRVTNAVAEQIDKIFGKLDSMSKGFGPMMEYASNAMSKVVKYVGFVFGLYAKVGSAVGAVFAEIYGHIDKLIQIVGQMGIFEILGTVISGTLTVMLTPLKMVAGALGLLSRAFVGFAKLLGFKFKEPDKSDKSAVGSAVRSVNITSDAESVAKDAQTKAFMQAMQPTGTKPATEVDFLKTIQDVLTDLRQKVLTEIKELPNNIYNSLTPLGQSIINAIPIPGKETTDRARQAADSGVFGIGGALISALTR